ncbi:MAG: hypothetical protein IKU37_02640 [Candidatus Gastranaerophilales bacterium]|nr:hypothetical protein [Candidatus Gastranaerophilales bacterium]
MHELFLKINKNKFTKYSFLSTVTVLIMAVLFVFISNLLLPYSLIEKNFNKATGLKIEFIEPKTNLDFHFNLNTQAKEINIYDKNKKTKFISINNPDISIKPINLLFNQIYLKKANIDNIQIKIKRNTKGEIDILKEINKNLFAPTSNKLDLTRINSNIKNINLIFDDEYKIKSKIKTNLKNTNATIIKRKKQFTFSQQGTIETTLNKNKQNATIDLNINSSFPFNTINSNNSNLNIALKNINLYIFKDFAKKYISKDIESLEGKINLTLKTEDKEQKLNLKIQNPTLKLNDKKIISPYKDGINLSSTILLDKSKITIKETKIDGKNLLLYLNGEILNPSSKKPKVKLNTEIKNTQINNLIPFIPDNAIAYRSEGIPTLKKSNFYGIAEGKINLDLLPLNANGDLKIKNIHIPNYPKPYKQNDVNIRFSGDTARIYTRIYTPDNEYVLVDGISKLDNSLWGKYSVKSTSKIDLAFAQLYLVPIQQIIGFNIGPVPIMNISGYGNIDINTQGTLSDAQVFGTFRAHNANTTIKGLQTKLTKADCELIFDDKDLFIEKIKGKLDDADFLLEGKTNIKGETKLNIKLNNAKTEQILKIFNSSIFSKPYLKYTKDIKANGGIKANIDLSGTIKNFENESFLELLEPSGNIVLHENSITLANNINLNNLSGILNFGKEQVGNFNFNINNSKFNTEFISKDPLRKIAKGKIFHIDTQIFSNKIALKDIFPSLNNYNFYSKLFLKTQGDISLNKINPDNLKHNGYLIGLNSSDIKDIKFNSGIIKFNDNKAHIDDLNISFKDGIIKANGSISNILSKEPIGDMVVDLNNLDLENLLINNEKIKISLGKIKNGQIIFKNNNLKLNSISLNYFDAPLFLNANIKDIYKTKNIASNFSTIINEKTADNVINPHLITPIKITGEIPIKGSFEGNNNDYTIDFSAIIPKNSDISFGGANLGDTSHKRELQGNISVAENLAEINNLKLIKYIANQNNKINPLIALKANGQIIQNDENFSYNNLRITTNTPINVRILNLIFKKSLLKKGNFDCNISLNGDIKLPKISGKINLYDLDIPLYDTKIDNIKLNISNKFIDGEILAKNKQSDANLKIHALNKLDNPYVIKDFILTSHKLDINNLLSSYNPSTNSKTDINIKNEIILKPNDIIIEKGSFDFKEVQYDKITAQNLTGNLAYKNGIANIKNAFLNIAEGSIKANGNYDINSAKLTLSAKMIDCDSNILTNNFLKLPNQIFGKMDGNLILSGQNLHAYEGINSIKSNINFSIDNGKMPKLGSLEYLLRAGNLLKNGLLGLSLNNLIEVLTPYKTGEFEKISGNLSINNGEIEKLNIFSKGKNLSLFLDGNYSILENFADIKIYGKLSQNISNALGAIGNASINQLVETLTQVKRSKNEKNTELQQKLDKIPPIENETTTPRYFKVRVLGDINKEDYIKNFNWI